MHFKTIRSIRQSLYIKPTLAIRVQSGVVLVGIADEMDAALDRNTGGILDHQLQFAAADLAL